MSFKNRIMPPPISQGPLLPPDLSQVVPSKRRNDDNFEVSKKLCTQIPQLSKEQLLFAAMKHDRDFKQMFFDAFHKL